MEAAKLSQSAFWSETDAELVVLGNPRRQGDLALVKKAAEQFPELAGHLIVETSGSSGAAKFVCLSRSALLCSARAVNSHLEVTVNDRWLCALPTFHVGGLGIYARGFCASNEVLAFTDEWHPETFAHALASAAATLTALVPTQVSDLVAADIKSPPQLRALIIGGGHLDETVEDRARQLGWPLLLSYGMTETCSQIATQSLQSIAIARGDVSKRLQLLAHCQVQNDADGRLAVRGGSLFSAYLVIGEAGDALLDKPFDDQQWFVTQDRVTIEGDHLIYRGRIDRQVKILGELVDLDRVEVALRRRLDPADRESVAVEAVADERRGFRLVPIVEQQISWSQINALIDALNQHSMPLERLEAAVRVDHFPRSPLGKMQRSALRALARLR